MVCPAQAQANVRYRGQRRGLSPEDYAKIDSSYQRELDEFFKKLIRESQELGLPVDVAFVDCGPYIRGDMVEILLQNQVPIVSAHDTANYYPNYPDLTEAKPGEITKGLFGWYKIQPHPEYEKIFMNYGAGTMFWVHKELAPPAALAALRTHRDNKVWF